VKVLALDYGPARTGVAVSDPTGTVARPLEVVERAASGAGLQRLVQLVHDEAAERVVVGLPLTLSGDIGEQARETQAFLATLREQLDVPVVTFDERFTTKLAGPDGDDARAAAYLLSGYLECRESRGEA
jgi:putative transcription antitermination factor YqgF